MVELAEISARLAAKVIRPAADEVLVIRGGRVVDGTGRGPIEDGVVVVRGERIERVGPAAEVEAPRGPEVRELDAAGLTVMPGLIDLHVHFTGDTEMDARRRYLPGNESYKTIVGAVAAAETLEAGFTTVRELGHGHPPNKYALTRAINEGLLYGPRMQNAGWSISQIAGHGDPHFLPQHWVQESRPRSTFASGVEDCRRVVRLNFGEGADLVKIYSSEGSLVAASVRKSAVPNFTLAETEAMVDEAHRRGARVASHATEAVGARTAVVAGVDTIEHGGSMGDDPEIFDLMARNGTFFNPTLTVYKVLITEGERMGVHPNGIATAKQLYRQIQEYIPALRAAGVKVSLGTDTGLMARGKNAMELELLVADAGFTPMEAIVAGTKTSAEAMGWSKEIGTLEPGKLADVLLVRGDPLADIRVLRDKGNVVRIVKAGSSLL